MEIRNTSRFLITVSICAAIIITLSSCAGGTRGTGIRYNRSVGPLTDLDQESTDESDNSEEEKQKFKTK
jgi:hypothetical protein